MAEYLGGSNDYVFEGQPDSSGTGYLGVNTDLSAPAIATSSPSFWDKLGSWAGKNKDLLLASALELNKYQKQQAANQAQNVINQAASKWSGFNPNLMNMVKPVETPDAAQAIMSTFAQGPRTWSELSEMYKAREEGRMKEWADAQREQAAKEAALSKGLNPQR